MKHLLRDHKVCPNQHKKSHRLCDGKDDPPLRLKEIQWKLREHDWNFPVEGRPVKSKCQGQKIEINPIARLRSHIRNLSGNLNNQSKTAQQSVSPGRVR